MNSQKLLIFLCAVVLVFLGCYKEDDSDKPETESLDFFEAAENELIYICLDFPPLLIANERNEINNGLFIEILDEVFTEQLGLTVRTEVVPWVRGQTMVADGIADMMVTVKSSERLEYSIPSDNPFFQLYFNVYTYDNHPRLEDIQSIENAADIARLNLIPVSNQGNQWHRDNIDAYGAETIYVEEDENIVQFLALERADIMIEPLLTMNYKIRELGLQDDIVVTDAQFGPVDFYIFLSKKSEYIDLMPQINDALDSIIANGKLEEITSRYINYGN